MKPSLKTFYYELSNSNILTFHKIEDFLKNFPRHFLKKHFDENKYYYDSEVTTTYNRTLNTLHIKSNNTFVFFNNKKTITFNDNGKTITIPNSTKNTEQALNLFFA